MSWNVMNFVRRSPNRRPQRLVLEALEDRSLPSATISGVAFQDYNANGLFDSASTIANNGAGGTGTIGTAVDQGVAGVTVQAFDVNNVLQATAVTAANGQYTLNPTDAGTSYRIEFSGLPAGFTLGPHGVANGAFPDASGTTVQFVGAGATNHVDLGLVRADQYSPNNPVLVTSVYYRGAASPANNAIVSLPYSAGETPLTTANPNNYNQPTTPTLAVPTSAVGSTFGLAWQQSTGDLYASAFYKSFSGYGPGGPGAVYQIKTNANGSYNSSSVFVDLNALFPGAAGADAHAAGFDDTGNAQWDAVGKTGLGGMAISPDGNTLYVMALGNRTLYAIPLNLGRPLTAADVRGAAVPLNAPRSASADDVRPFAVTYYNGQIYVGVVNTAESTNPAVSGSSSTTNGTQSELHAYVYAVTDNGASLAFGAAPAFDMDLGPAGGSIGAPTTYPRGSANKGDGAAGSANWLAWSPVVKNLESAGRGLSVYPQAMLTSLAFDANGNMVLGFRDRVGDETTPTNALAQGRPAGDVLRAFGNPAAGWTLENNGSGTLGANNAKGPGGGEFYYQQDYPTFHDHVPLGSVVQIPGFPDVAGTMFDPVRDTAIAPLFSGGLRWFNNANGQDDKDYLIYNQGTPSSFGKANGMGGLTVMTQPAPIEIGNRVWLDANGDGIQGANELGIGGVTVDLYNAAGVLLAAAVTDANGNYFFSNGAGANTPNSIYNIAGLTANSAGYTVRLDNPANYAGVAPLAGLVATKAFGGSDPAVDSNGQVVAGFDRATAAVGTPGASDHTTDFGFFAPAGVSGFVYSDVNNNGVRDPGDLPISTVAVTLLNASGVAVANTTTNGSGFYQFAGLAPGTYTVAEGPTPTYLQGTNNLGTVNASADGAVGPAVDQLSNIALTSGQMGVNYNFGEIVPASISGFTYVDVNTNGVRDPADLPIPGVAVTLLNAGGVAVANTTTDATGFYQFTGLAPGTYSVVEGATPSYLEGTNNLGTVNGAADGVVGPALDHISSVTLAPGQGGVNYNFGEVIPATLSGFVYVDANKDGVRDPGDPPIPGVPITLLDATGKVVAVTTTDPNGFYQFTGLAGGTYTVEQGPTPGYLEGTNNIGSVNGAVNGAIGTGADQFTSVVLDPGQNGATYNFGKILAAPVPPGGALVTNPPVIGKAGLLGSNVLSATALADVAFVNRLYVTVLGRAPDPGSQNALTAALQSGLSRTVPADMIWRSPEHRGDEVDALYEQILHRPSDPVGRAGWVQAFLMGATEADVARAFLDSPEYAAAHPDASSFVTGLYTDLLGRAPDPVGFAGFQQALAGGASRDLIASDFLASTEYLTDIVDGYYTIFLGRPADPVSQAALAGALQHGMSLEMAADAILASDEFFAHGQ